MNPFLRALTALAAALLGGALSAQPVVIHEIHHSPDVKQEPVEFIELHNRSRNTVDLTGVTLSGQDALTGVRLTFGRDVIMRPGEYAVAVSDPDAFRRRYGDDAAKKEGDIKKQAALEARKAARTSRKSC